MVDPHRHRMVTFFDGELPTPTSEIDRCTVTEEHLIEFLRRTDWRGGSSYQTPESVPISYALALRRAHGPEVAVAPDAFAIHGGHDIQLETRLAIGRTYVVTGCVDQIFEKTGRSGPMTVVGRRVWIHEEPSGTLAATIRDQQIIRWRPTAPASTSDAPPDRPSTVTPIVASATMLAPSSSDNLDVGDAIGPFVRSGPSAADISGWAGILRDREVLFHDPEGSRALGYANLVVPGPMQSAFVDGALWRRLPAWSNERMDMTFRQSLLANQPIVIEGIVVDADGARRTCDVVIRSGVSGEITSAGSVTLIRRD